jgi:hypothetical protein
MIESSRLELYLQELKALVTDPIHKRLLSAYTGDEPKESVELELDRLLIEVLKSED